MTAATRVLTRLLATAALALASLPALAQTAPLAGRVELAAGILWSGGDHLPSHDAALLAPDGSAYRLFSTSTTVEAAAGVDARIGVTLTKTLQVEFSASYSRPDLRSSLSNDVEQAAAVVASEGIQQFIFDGALVVHLHRWTVGGRAVPFVIAGAGYLRDLHDEQTLAVTGQSFHFGGGVKYEWLTRPGKKMKGLGLRADVQALARRKGTAVDDNVHVSPAVNVGVFARF